MFSSFSNAYSVNHVKEAIRKNMKLLFIKCLTELFDRIQIVFIKSQYIYLIIIIIVALLSGARNNNNIVLSQNIYDRMEKLFPQTRDPLVSAAILLANVYASSGEIDKASDIRIQLNKSNMRKKIGLTWTVNGGEIYVSLKLIIIIFYIGNI